MKMVVNNNLVKRAKKKYEAQIEEVKTLHIYFTNSVGIGEHQTYYKWISMLRC